MTDYEKRAKDLRDRLFIARIKVKDLAKKLERSRQHVSMVLNGGHESKVLLERIEEILDEADESRYALAA